MPADAVRPLAGIRVVDLTSNIAAPFAGAVLADLGAQVVHVEAPAGDDSRRMAPTVGDSSAYFHVVNRGKSGTRLDIGDPAGRAVLDALLAEADVFLCNLRPTTIARHGLDAQTLSTRFPRLIHGHLTGYGARGQDRDGAGYDGVLQARTGIAAVTGEAEGPPVRAGVSILDVGAGTWLALGVITGLYQRERTGLGCSISTSLLETGASWVAYHVVAHQVTGEPSARHGSGHPAFAPYGIFQAADGQVCIGIGGDAIFARMCAALGLESLLEDPRFATNPARVHHEAALKVILADTLAGLTVDEVIAQCAEHSVAVDAVRQPEDLLGDAQARGNEIFQVLWRDGDRGIEVPGLPFTIDGQRPTVAGPGPA